eukprot:274077-Rhodomonas_salina.1
MGSARARPARSSSWPCALNAACALPPHPSSPLPSLVFMRALSRSRSLADAASLLLMQLSSC